MSEVMPGNQALPAPETPGITPVPPGLTARIDLMPCFNELLPFKFGKNRLETLSVNCAGCGVEVTVENIRGSIEATGDGKTATIQAYAMCYGCRTISPVDAKFHDDGTAIFKGPNSWVKGTWDANPLGLHHALLNILQKKWQAIVPPVIALILVISWIVAHR